MYDYPTPWPTSCNVNRMQTRLQPTLVHSPSSVIVCPTMKMSRFLCVATCAFVVVVAPRLQAAAQEKEKETPVASPKAATPPACVDCPPASFRPKLAERRYWKEMCFSKLHFYDRT